MFGFSKSSNKISQAFNSSLRQEEELTGWEKRQRDLKADLKMAKEDEKRMKAKGRKRRNQKVDCCRQLPQHRQEIPTMNDIMTINGYVDNHSGTTSLFNFMMESNVPKTQSDFAQQVVLGTMNALKQLHDRGIAHGSLSPSSIGININRSMGHVTRVEARQVRLLYTTKRSPVVGDEKEMTSCAYASPQKLQGKKTDGRLDDMWAAGCILLELRFGLPKDWESTCLVMSQSMQGSNAAKRGIARALYRARMASYLKRIRNTKVSSTEDFHLQNLLCRQLLLKKAAHRAFFANSSLQHPWFCHEYAKSA